jgi:TPR repeat protein
MVVEQLVFRGPSALPMNFACFARLAVFSLVASLPLALVAGPSEDANAAFKNGDYATALRLWRDLAEQGNASAQASLGYMYETGRGVTKDETQAVLWYRKSAEQGDARGQTNLGNMYANGRGVVKDEAEAVLWYRAAAEQGNAQGQLNLGHMYETGSGVAKDKAEAAKWYRKAAQPANANVAYTNGDYATALRLWRELAEQGNASAQASLGYMYETGRGVTKDETQAVLWYRKSAEQGDARGQTNLGNMYANGRGVAKDEAEAVLWYRKAAEQGNAQGQVNLGFMYQNGRGGLPQDDRQAVEWYRKAAEQGDARGQSALGFMYQSGRGGLPQDDKQAVEWYRKAADQGNAVGQAGLGFIYETGRGVTKDEAEASQWYKKAAEQGEAAAQTNLGIMYREGRGVAKDDAEAERWFRKAAEQGNARAQTLLSSIEQARRDVTDLSRTVAELIKANEKLQPAIPVTDPERARLAREVIDASGVSAALTSSPDELNEKFAAAKPPSKISPKLWEAMGVTYVASFRPGRILATMERRLAETLDAATLQVGLRWEHSDLAGHMRRLELEASKPEQRASLKDFERELAGKGGRTNEPRARACAQADTLSNQTEALAPFFEALMAGTMIAYAQQAPAPDMDSIRRAVVSVRPLLRERAREVLLTQCLFTYRDLSDAEVEQSLEFLRSDSGGRYARGFNDALRDSLLDVTEVFTRTLLEVARQIKGRGDS